MRLVAPGGSRRRRRARRAGPRDRRARASSSAPSRTTSARRPSSRPRRRMTSLRLAGFRAVRVTSYWTPGLTTAERRRAPRAPKRRRRSRAERRARLRHRHEPRLGDDAAHRRGARRVRLLRGRDRAGRPVARARHRRQRAEPQPLLAPPVRPRRHECRARRVPRAARADVRRAEGRLARRSASTAARCLPAEATGQGDRAPPTRRRRSSASSEPRIARAAATGPSWTRSSSIPTRTTRASRPPTAHPNSTTIGVADYGKLVALLGEAFDGTAQPGSELPILYGEFGVESEIPAAKGVAVHGHRADDDEAGQRGDAGRLLRAGARAGVLPADGRRDAALPLTRRARARGWQSGIHYVDGTPKTSRARVTEALDRTTGGSITRCPGVELPVRPTSLRFGTRSAAKRGIFRVTFALRPRLPLLGSARERASRIRRSSRRRARPRSASSSRRISGRVDSKRGRTATRSGWSTP